MLGINYRRTRTNLSNVRGKKVCWIYLRKIISNYSYSETINILINCYFYYTTPSTSFFPDTYYLPFILLFILSSWKSIDTHILNNNIFGNRLYVYVYFSRIKCIRELYDHPIFLWQNRDLVIERLSTFRPSSSPLLIPLSTSFYNLSTPNSPLFPLVSGMELAGNATTRAQLTRQRRQAVRCLARAEPTYQFASVSARLNTATGEISRNPGATEEKNRRNRTYSSQAETCAVGRFHFNPRVHSTSILYLDRGIGVATKSQRSFIFCPSNLYDSSGRARLFSMIPFDRVY